VGNADGAGGGSGEDAVPGGVGLFPQEHCKNSRKKMAIQQKTEINVVVDC